MTTKKQTKASERRRREQLERKIAQRRAQRMRRWRVAAIVIAVLVVAGALTWLVLTAADADVDTTASPSAASTATPTPTPDAADEPEPEDSLEVADGWGASPAPPDPAYAEGRTWEAVIETNQGPITMELHGDAAPQAVASFIALAGDGFFANTDCHRLVTAGIYVLQCGDPMGTGTGGPSYRYGPIENAPDDDVYPAGTVAMARQGGNAESMGSQFFLVYEDSTIPSDAAGGYTVFGTITDGLAMVEQVAQAGTIAGTSDGRPAVSVIIDEVSVS